MEDFVKEGAFVIAEGCGESLYVFIESKKGTPETPRIMYDGGDHALFFRDNDQRIILDYINPEIRAKLRAAKQIIVVESVFENINESYYVDVQIVSKLPIDFAKYDLKTWEEASLS